MYFFMYCNDGIPSYLAYYTNNETITLGLTMYLKDIATNVSSIDYY